MKYLAHDLFLLMGQLFQIKSAETVKKIFIESFDNSSVDFSLSYQKEKDKTIPIILRTKRKNYGTIYLNVDPDTISAEFAAIFYNAIQMLGVILEKLEYEKLLSDKVIENEKKYRTYVDNSPVAIFVSDETTKFIEVNNAACQLLGFNKDELLSRSLTEIITENSLESIEKLKDEGFFRGETCVINNKGKNVFIDISSNKLSENRYISFCIDITEKQQLETQLYQSQKLESIGNLAAGIAHDFNNLLTVIMGNADLLRFKLPDDIFIIDLLEDIISASQTASELTRKMLLFSRKEAMDFIALNLNDSINDLLKILQRMIGENVTIKTDLADDLKILKGDKNNIEQVILNIASNARDAMTESGNLLISTKNLTIDETNQIYIPHSRVGEFIVLSMEDNGVGISKDVLEKVFDPFYTTKEVGKGTGLGLSVVYGIVKKHNGWINVYSEIGHGSVFRIYLPVLYKYNNTQRKNETPSSLDIGKRNEKILFIEDNHSVLKFGKKLLSEYGFIVNIANNAKEARKVFRENNFNYDLIVSDVILPDMNGVDLVEELKQKNNKIKVLMISGYADNKSRIKIKNNQNINFLSKPFNNNVFIQLIVDILDNTND